MESRTTKSQLTLSWLFVRSDKFIYSNRAPTGEQCIPRVKQICHGVGIETLHGIVTEFDSGNQLQQPGIDVSDVAGLLQLV